MVQSRCGVKINCGSRRPKTNALRCFAGPGGEVAKRSSSDGLGVADTPGTIEHNSVLQNESRGLVVQTIRYSTFRRTC